VERKKISRDVLTCRKPAADGAVIHFKVQRSGSWLETKAKRDREQPQYHTTEASDETKSLQAEIIWDTALLDEDALAAAEERALADLLGHNSKEQDPPVCDNLPQLPYFSDDNLTESDFRPDNDEDIEEGYSSQEDAEEDGQQNAPEPDKGIVMGDYPPSEEGSDDDGSQDCSSEVRFGYDGQEDEKGVDSDEDQSDENAENMDEDPPSEDDNASDENEGHFSGGGGSGGEESDPNEDHSSNEDDCGEDESDDPSDNMDEDPQEENNESDANEDRSSDGEDSEEESDDSSDMEEDPQEEGQDGFDSNEGHAPEYVELPEYVPLPAYDSAGESDSSGEAADTSSGSIFPSSNLDPSSDLGPYDGECPDSYDLLEFFDDEYHPQDESDEEGHGESDEEGREESDEEGREESDEEGREESNSNNDDSFIEQDSLEFSDDNGSSNGGS
jgi:hypothetical protein